MKHFPILLALLGLFVSGCAKPGSPESLPAGEHLFIGTVSVDYEDAVYDNKDVSVKLVEEDDGTLTLIIYDIKFVPKMPVTVTVTVPGITCYKYGGGRWVFSGDNIVPYSGIIPFSARTVYQLEGTLQDGNLSFSLLFGDSPTRFTGVQQGKSSFSASAMSKYF